MTLVLSILVVAYRQLTPPQPHPTYIHEAYRVREAIIKQLQCSKNFCLIGLGGGMMENVKLINLEFNHYQSVTTDEARILIVDCVEIAKELMNRDEGIRPYLPISLTQSENFGVGISFYNPDKTAVQKGAVTYVTLFNNNIQYYTTPGLVKIHRETYAEALEITKNDKHKQR